MSMKPEIKLTADGSHTLFVSELDEHYHSINGAVQESIHVFINKGLHHHQKDNLHILEIGFGTGLNAILTLIDPLTSNKKIFYTTIEAYPINSLLVEQLNYAPSHKDLFKKLHDAPWNRREEIAQNFSLLKIETDFPSFDFSKIDTQSIDLIYFDAFGPDKQPNMWTQELFDKLYTLSNENAILVTYCAKGAVRRMLQQSGFTVERLDGPPGKREMIRATKKQCL